MNNKEAKQTILCMYSGGIDSTGVLHRLLTAPEFDDYALIVHHIHIVNRENRALAEAGAVKSILDYYKNHVSKVFTITASTFNTSGFAPLKSNRFPFDMDVCAFTSANICAARKDIVSVAMGRTKTDIDSGGENFRLRMDRAQSIFKSVLSLEKRVIPKYIFPVVGHTKQEIWNFLPPEVRSHTWWCRRPSYDNGIPKACGKCQTCKDVKDFANASI